MPYFAVSASIPDGDVDGLASAKTVSTPVRSITGLKVNLQISGTFNGLADGASVVINGVTTTIHYSGGTGNDLTLTVPPAKSSILGRYGAAGQWWMAASTGSSFSNSLWASWNPNVTWVDVQTGDFNGDGHADIIGRYLQSGQWYVGISNVAQLSIENPAW